MGARAVKVSDADGHASGRAVPSRQLPAVHGTSLAASPDLSGRDGLLYRRNSLTGAIEAVRRKGVGVTLNEALHA